MRNTIKILLKSMAYIYGWGGRIRTYGTRDQNPMPYHLATPQSDMQIQYLKIIFKYFRISYSIKRIILFGSVPCIIGYSNIFIEFT